MGKVFPRHFFRAECIARELRLKGNPFLKLCSVTKLLPDGVFMHKCFLGHPLSLHLNSFIKRAKLLQHRLRILRNTLPYGLGKRDISRD